MSKLRPDLAILMLGLLWASLDGPQELKEKAARRRPSLPSRLVP
jgi:hypothetical protein